MKGFMVYVEGGKSPKKVHVKADSAYREMYRLSKLFPDREVMIFQLIKRVRKDESIKPKSLGSHIPKDAHGLVDKDQLVRYYDATDFKKTIPQALEKNDVQKKA